MLVAALHGRNPREEANKALRDEIEQERLSLQISKKASAVIAEVAQRTDEQNAVERTQALVQALERQKIAWRQQYDVGLTAYIRVYERVEQEIRLRAEMDAEDELLLL